MSIVFSLIYHEPQGRRRGEEKTIRAPTPSPPFGMEERAGERFPRRNSRIEPLNLLKSDIANLPKRGNRFSLSAFCGVGGAKWGEGRGEVFRFTKNRVHGEEARSIIKRRFRNAAREQLGRTLERP